VVKRIGSEIGDGEESATRWHRERSRREKGGGEAADGGEGINDSKRGNGAVTTAAGMKESSVATGEEMGEDSENNNERRR